MNEVGLRAISEGLSDEQRNALASMRGGCSCHLSPPCGSCIDPLTTTEAIDLGVLCGSCEGSGRVCVGTSGQDADGNAPETERCPECGFGDDKP